MGFFDVVSGDLHDAFEAAGQLAAQVPSTGRFLVNHDNVLAAAKIIHTQAHELGEALRDRREELRVPSPGDDLISVRATAAWNDILLDDADSYANRIDQYVTSLKGLVDQLSQTARDYGYTEDDISAAFGGRIA